MRTLDCEQYTPEWWKARVGIPTASGADKIITASGKPSSSADAYIAELIDNCVRPLDSRSQDEQDAAFKGNRHTERGHELEPKARDFYAFTTGATVRQVGMILRDDELASCSPDGIVTLPDGTEGGLEIKAPEGKKHVLWMMNRGLPDEHKQQVHYSLAVSGLAFWDFMSICPGYKTFRVRVTPDDYTIKVAAALDAFIARLEAYKAEFIDYLPRKEQA